MEASRGLRKDGLAEERDSMEAEGHAIKESSGRKLTRYAYTGKHCFRIKTRVQVIGLYMAL